MNSLIKVLFNLILGFVFLTNSTIVKAQSSPQFHLVFPVRGSDFWQRPYQPVKTVKQTVDFLNQNQLPATFLLRWDALNDPAITQLLKNNPNLNLGLFLEITPSLADSIKLDYPTNDSRWYYPDRVFTVGYNLNQRQKIIDAYVNKFKQVFSKTPDLIGAWYIDSFSINYFSEKYKIKSFLIVSDQDGTDHYLVWGLPFSRNYHPAYLNPLVPGKTATTIYQWAPRDIFNGLDNASKKSSLYSLQTNDYLKLNYNLDYWYSAIDDYKNSQTTQPLTLILGLENDEINPQAYTDLFTGIVKLKNQSFIFVKNLKPAPTAFFNVFQSQKQSQTAYLIQNQNYRLYLKTDSNKTSILDLRSFKGNDYPVFWSFYPNKNHLLYAQTDALIDAVQLKNPIVLNYPVRFDSKTNSLTANGQTKISFDQVQIKFTDRVDPKLKRAVNSFTDIKLTKSSLIFSSFYKNQLKLNLLSIVWLIIFVILAFFILNKFFGKVKSLFIIFLSFIWSFPLLLSGLPTKFGLGFWGPNGHDAIWHLALSRSILNGWPINHPTLSGQLLTNYHFGFDLILATLSKLTHIPLTFLYFQILPLIMALAILLLSYKLYIRLFASQKGALFSLFFIVNAGSLGFIITIIKKQPLGGESAFWANQAISTLLNPPFATSLILILISLLLLTKRPRTTLDYFSIFTLPAITLWFKVYGGLFAGFIIGLWFVRQLYLKKIAGLNLLAGVWGGLLFLVSLKLLTGSQSLIVIKPLWFVVNMFIFPDRVGWFKFGQALTTYLQSLSPKLVIALPVALVIFYLGNFGTRIISLASLKQLKPKNKDILLILWAGIITFALIPIFIIQKGTPWNSIQFLYYPLFFTAFLSGTFFINLPSSLKFKNLVIMITIMMTIPTTIATLSYYLPAIPHASLPWEEVKALSFLAKQPRGNILTLPHNPYLKDIYNNPTPLFAYVDTAYVTAFSGQTAYLADTMNLDISGYDYKQRQTVLNRLYDPSLPDSYKNKLLVKITKENNLKYIYILHLPQYKLTPPAPWQKIYQNSLVEIWKL